MMFHQKPETKCGYLIININTLRLPKLFKKSKSVAIAKSGKGPNLSESYWPIAFKCVLEDSIHYYLRGFYIT